MKTFVILGWIRVKNFGVEYENEKMGATDGVKK